MTIDMFFPYIRHLWRHYFQNIQGLIFVDDNNDKDLFVKVRDDMYRKLKSREKLYSD